MKDNQYRDTIGGAPKMNYGQDVRKTMCKIIETLGTSAGYYWSSLSVIAFYF